MNYLKCKKIETAISRATTMLVAREANKGLYENFGQDEVSKIKDVFIDSSSYTDEMNRNRDKVNNFSNWCSSYNGQQ